MEPAAKVFNAGSLPENLYETYSTVFKQETLPKIKFVE